ncbi:hypothetical protein HNR30_008812 [Nonomuraea soli]|uniref:Uncharacterized protein n=1 Tax=Nonomuraea soli TaxID=1032476 RepID=A0A7W0HVN7_9ACTN|nr:hypothetical protein [Nonomuraea soli]
MVDGAWWPYSRDAAAELPHLIAAVDQRLGRITRRVNLWRDAWQRVPSHIPARGRQVRIGWPHRDDPRVITLGFVIGEPVVLLVIPPGTTAGAAEAALALTAQTAAGLSIDALFTLARLSAYPPPRAEAGRTSSRKNEGGSITGQRAESLTGRQTTS